MQPLISSFEAYGGDDDLDFAEIFRLKLTRSGLLVDVEATHDDWKTIDGENGDDWQKRVSMMGDAPHFHLHVLFHFHLDDCLNC